MPRCSRLTLTKLTISRSSGWARVSKYCRAWSVGVATMRSKALWANCKNGISKTRYAACVGLGLVEPLGYHVFCVLQVLRNIEQLDTDSVLQRAETALHDAEARARLVNQNGRASCRERVGRYV